MISDVNAFRIFGLHLEYIRLSFAKSIHTVNPVLTFWVQVCTTHELGSPIIVLKIVVSLVFTSSNIACITLMLLGRTFDNTKSLYVYLLDYPITWFLCVHSQLHFFNNLFLHIGPYLSTSARDKTMLTVLKLARTITSSEQELFLASFIP